MTTSGKQEKKGIFKENNYALMSVIKMVKELGGIFVVAVGLLAILAFTLSQTSDVLQIEISQNGTINYLNFSHKTYNLAQKLVMQNSGVKNGGYDILVDAAGLKKWRFQLVQAGYYYVVEPIPAQCVIVTTYYQFSQFVDSKQVCKQNG